MIKYYCDHCGDEITGPGFFKVASKEVFGALDTITGVLCYDCNERLGRFLNRAEEFEEEDEEEEDENE